MLLNSCLTLSGDLYLSLSTWLVYLLSPSWEKDHQRFSMLGHVSKVRMYFPWNNYLQILLLYTVILFFSFILIVHSSSQVPSSIQVINYKNISSSSILLYWDPPEYPNGKITHYTIYAMELDTNRAFQMTTIDNSFLIAGRTKFCFDILFLMENTHLSMPLNTAGHVLHHSRFCCAVLPWISWKILAEITWLDVFFFNYICLQIKSSDNRYPKNILLT